MKEGRRVKASEGGKEGRSEGAKEGRRSTWMDSTVV